MTNEPNTPKITSYADRARYSASKEGAPIMPLTVRRLPPRPRRNSVKHRAIR